MTTPDATPTAPHSHAQPASAPEPSGSTPEAGEAARVARYAEAATELGADGILAVARLSKALALVSLNDERPFRAYWPVRFTQIIGGKRWSLSLCTYRTPKPVVIEPRTASLDEAFGEETR